MMMRPRQGNKARAKRPCPSWLQTLPSGSAGICWLGKQKELGGLVPCLISAPLASHLLPAELVMDGHSELGEARPQLILSADSQGLWKRSFLVQWGQRSGVYSSGFQSLSQWELWTSTLGWDVRVCSCAHVCPCMPARGDEDSGFNCVVPGAHYRGA